MDAAGAEVLVVIVKGSWTICDGASLVPAEAQQPIHHAAVYAADSAVSSLIYDSDMVPEKPGIDCVLRGHAWAPTTNTRELDVTFAVGPVRKTVKVFGERVWQKRLGLCAASKPVPFEKIPLSYERAFGGMDKSGDNAAEHEFCAENPVGVGFRARRSRLKVDGAALPNLEDPKSLLKKPSDRPKAAGFGMVAPAWQPRVRHAGTHDEHWRKYLSPLLPDDFDPRFYCAAAEGLTSAAFLQGDEEVLVENASPVGRLQLRLPGVRPRVTLRRDLRRLDLSLDLDTVVVEPDEARLQLVWRGRHRIEGRLDDYHWIRIGLEGGGHG